MALYKLHGIRFRACNPMCASSYKEDRHQGLIYPPYRIINDDGTSEITGVDKASVACGFCAYCGADIRMRTTK